MLKRLSATLGMALALAPATFEAQSQCAVELGKPGQVKDGYNALAKAALFTNKPDQAALSVKEAIAKIQKDEAKVIQQNPVGRAMVLGTAYSEFFVLPGNSGTVSRGSIGLVTDPTGTIDLVAAADSMLDIVDASNPACKEETEGPRRKIYAALVNDAVNQYNSQNADSALVLARRGLSVYDDYKLAYIAYNIQGNALQTKDSLDAAVASFTKMAALMQGDTSLVEDRKTVMSSVSNVLLAQAEQLDGEAKTAKIAQVTEYLQKYLQEFPGDPKAEAALARAQIMSGDPTAAERVFGQMTANPDKYTDQQLFEAGVNAARADKPKEAVALFEAGLKKNPYSRDALFNIALTQQKLENYAEAEKHLRSLVKVDPENPEVYQVFALNYQALARSAKEAAAKKPATSPEAAAFKAANDSLLHYFQRFQDAPVKVSFNLWSHNENKHVLAGTLENLTDAAKSYTLKFEFLDATGKVVTTKDATLDAVGAKGSKAFRVEVEGEGVIAFRYAPLN
jgi:tetratricopeptide (TPR) repeat protein